MIVVMKSGSTPAQVEHVVQLVREMGLKDHVIVGTERTVVAVIGDDRFKDRSAFESVNGVEKVVPVLAPYKMASREVQKERSVVQMGANPAARVGGTKVAVIAGPCSVESRNQLLETAHAVKESGAVGLRGGAFKPRTNPYSFQGLAEKGLELLAMAREETGLAVVTEVMAVDQVDLVARYADVLQVGRGTCRTSTSSTRWGSRASRCCSSAASVQRWRNSCSPPSTSWPKATAA